MKSGILVSLGSVLLALVLSCVPPARAQAPNSDSPAGELFWLLNQSRKEAGLPAFAWDQRLAEAARRHAELMADHQQLSHALPGEPPLQQRLAQVPLALSGENVAVDASVSGANKGLMHSPLHRANILSRQFDSVGIGVVQRAGRMWIVQDFAQRIPEMPNAQAEAAIAQAAARLRSNLREVQDGRVRRLACRMAQAGRLDYQPALALPAAQRVAAYTSLDPRQLPRDAHRLLALPDASQLAVGACFARTPLYPSGVYWVLMVLYGRK